MQVQFEVIAIKNPKAPHVGKKFASRSAAWAYFKKIYGADYYGARDFWKNSGYDLKEVIE